MDTKKKTYHKSDKKILKNVDDIKIFSQFEFAILKEDTIYICSVNSGELIETLEGEYKSFSVIKYKKMDRTNQFECEILLLYALRNIKIRIPKGYIFFFFTPFFFFTSFFASFETAHCKLF